MNDTFTRAPMSYTGLDDARWRSHEDLLQSERTLRRAAEDAVRELRQVLLETVIRLDGKRFESLRRDDPAIPGKWAPADWRRYMNSISRPPAWPGLDVSDWDRQKREWAQQIEELKAALANTQRLLADERERAASAERPAAEPVQGAPVTEAAEGMTPPLDVIVGWVRTAVKAAPSRPPAAFSKILDGGGRTGGDRARVWPRYWAVLYLLGHCQVSAVMEIEQALAALFDVSAGAGSMRRMIGDLADCHLVDVQTLSMTAPRTSLKVARLSTDGERLYEAVFREKPLENDWSRMVRLHEGDRYEEHALAVAAFAMHARRRGWATRILPEVEGNAMPDLCVADAQARYYVEVELSTKENTAKWRNLAALNGGTAALCAGTTANRARLVGDCKLLGLKGAATDLETLIATRFKDSSGAPLWMEVW